MCYWYMASSIQVNSISDETIPCTDEELTFFCLHAKILKHSFQSVRMTEGTSRLDYRQWIRNHYHNDSDIKDFICSRNKQWC